MSSEPQPGAAGADRPLFLAIAGNIGVGKVHADASSG